MKRFTGLVLIFTILAGLVPAIFVPKVAEAALGDNASVHPINRIMNGLSRYVAVGFMYYEIMSKNDGTWDITKPHPVIGKDMSASTEGVSHTYTFNFPDRRVSSVKVKPFDPATQGDIFAASRTGSEPWYAFEQYSSSTITNYQITNVYGTGSSTVTFTASVSALLSSSKTFDVREQYGMDGIDYCPKCTGDTLIYRYFIPVLFEFQLDGREVVHHYLTDGTLIDADFPNQSFNVTQGGSLAVTPATNAKYEYVGYKKSTVAPPSGGTISSGNPPDVPYDGTYDRYYVNLYYKIKSNNGIAHIRYVDRSGNPIPGLIGKDVDLVPDKPFSPSFAAPPTGYQYIGYVKTTTGVEPTDFSSPIKGEYPTITAYHPAAFKTLHLYYVYDVISAGKVYVRHMVKAGASGTYTQAGEKTVPITTLPSTRTEYADASYGSIVGYSVDFTSYSNTPTSTSNSAYVSISAASPEAYVTFFYQAAASFTGDFDVVPPTIAYRDSFTLRPKNFQLNGCTYISHQWKIERNGLTYISPAVNGMNKDTVYASSNYPNVIAVGTHNVSMRITTSCGDSPWIGPKTLTVTGPAQNNPPQFQIAWVRPAEPLKPVYEVLEGETLNLVVIQDPTVPTPVDPDGDDIYFDGFDFSTSSIWAKQIPSHYQAGWMSYNNIRMDGLGYHSVKASMRDEFGAAAIASTYINVIPPNPVAVIKGPKQVVEGRPLSSAFDANDSYSPVGRTINHARDEWKNKKTLYVAPGKEVIELDVYDDIGLKSAVPAKHELTVLEDLPPDVDIKGPLSVVRKASNRYTVSAISPDGDKIVSLAAVVKYDSDNDGLYSDETATAVTLNAGQSFDRIYDKVGHYQYTVCAQEDWGKSACKSIVVTVVNDSPTVSFDVSSFATEPLPINPIPIKANDIVKSARWRNSDTATPDKAKGWSANPNGSLGAVPYNKGSLHTYEDLKSFDSITDIKASIVTSGIAAVPNGSYYSYDVGGHIWINNNFSAQNASHNNGTDNRKIFIYKSKNTYDSSTKPEDFARDGNSMNGFEWNEESLYAVDSFHDRVVTKVYKDREVKYAVYTTDNFVNPAGKPMMLSDTPPSGVAPPNPYNYLIQGGAFYDVGRGTDAGGAYMESIQWDGSNKVKMYGSATSVGVNISTSFEMGNLGNRYFIQNVDKDGYPAGLLRKDAYTNALKWIANAWANKPDQFVVSPDEKYALFNESSSNSWNIVNLATGSVTKNLFATSKELNYRYNDVYIFGGEGYKIAANGTSLTKIWTSPYAGMWVSFPQARTFTNDGFMYYAEQERSSKDTALIALKSLDVLTGAIKRVAAFDTQVYYPHVENVISGVNFVSDDTLMVSVYNNLASQYSIFFTGTLSQDQSRPLSTQNQLYSDSKLVNLQLLYQIKLNQLDTDQLYAGFAYRMQDNENMYRVEHNRKSVRLVKVVNGKRSILKEAAAPIDEGVWSAVKVIVQDERHKVYVGGVPLIDVRDATFNKRGYFGPYAEIPRTEFKAMSSADLDTTSTTTEYRNIAIAGEDVTYNNYYEDPEKDPAVKPLTQWAYHKIADHFLDAGDGRSGSSSLDGKTFTTPNKPFDKVGLYRVSYAATDDPHPSFMYPSMVFADSRKDSNEYTADIIVHRKPISLFALTPQADGTIKWTDNSHDPDRYLSATNYSTEAGGIDYKKTRGILEKRFYYITPSGTMVREKLVAPQETGQYEVGMAVRDEYGAWSDYYVQYVDVGRVAELNTPPVPGFTSSHVNTFRGVPIVFNSTAYDKEDGARESLPHEYYIRNATKMTTETLQSTARTNWTKSFNSIGTFNVRQVVADSLGVSAQHELQVTIHNRLPAASITTPASADQTSPTKLDTLRPTFRWTYSDADNDIQSQYQIRIYRYGGILLADTNMRTGAGRELTWNTELPENVHMYVVVRVFDGYDWSGWSSPKYFSIETNRPPVADFDWLPQPAWEGDMLQIVNRSLDPDGDALTSRWTILTPAARSFTYSSDPVIANAMPGIYTVQLDVSDGRATAAVTKEIAVAPLTIDASIRHMDEWKQVHDREGHETKHNPKDFYAGENILTHVKTSAGAAVKAVTVKLAASGMDGTDLTMEWHMRASGSNDRYEAEIVDPRWTSLQSGLARGKYSLQFVALYDNGITKTTTVPFRIVGSIHEAVRIHRRQ